MNKCLIWLVLSLIYISCGEEKETIQPEIGEMTVSVYAPVTVVPKNKYKVFPEVRGQIKKLLASEGDVVTAGQTLAVVEAVREHYDLQSAKLQSDLVTEKLEGQTGEIKQLENEIFKLKAQFKTDSINYMRQVKLWEQNIGSRSELDTRQLKYEISQQNLDLSKKKYQQLKLELENTLEQSKINVKRSSALLGDYIIKSPTNSKIYLLNKEAGESVNQQEVFAVLGDPSEFTLELEVDEVDIAEVQLGQLVLVKLDAFPDMVFEAVIEKIYPSKNTLSQSFKVEAVFKDKPKTLYDGLSGEANIVIERKEYILTIPLDYVTRDGKVLNGEEEVIDVVLGKKNMTRIEVVSGIDSSSVLIKPE